MNKQKKIKTKTKKIKQLIFHCSSLKKQKKKKNKKRKKKWKKKLFYN